MRLVIAVAVAGLGVSGHCYAQGALDWADPCIKQEQTFNSSAAAARARADEQLQTFDAQVDPPAALRSHYVEAIREGYFKVWIEDPNVIALIERAKKDGTFDEKAFFLESVYPKAMTPEREAEIIRQVYKRDYEQQLRPKLVADRETLEKTLNEKKDEVDSACSPDVVSQVLRATVGNMVGLIDANFKAAANEDGDIAKFVRATSGVSLTDIQTHGLQGGPNSFVNEVLGGERSVARDAIRVLDVPNWEIKIPGPVIIVPGVCLPWC